MLITPSTETQKKSGNRTIVIAGGKTRDMLSLSVLLERFAYKVHSAYTAPQALELISSARPALVIADPVLAGANRTDLLHQLLQQDRAVASIPVIYMVFPSDAAMEQKCLAYGAAGCISKPVQAEELFHAVQVAIEPNPAPTSGSTPACLYHWTMFLLSAPKMKADARSTCPNMACSDVRALSPEQAAHSTDLDQRPDNLRRGLGHVQPYLGNRIRPKTRHWAQVHCHRAAGPGVHQKVRTR